MKPTKESDATAGSDAHAEGIDQMLEEHEELRARIEEIRIFLKDPRPRPGDPGAQTWCASLAQLLVDLHDRLFRHFRTEEQDDGFAALAQRRTWAFSRLQDLIDEHTELLGELKGVIETTVGYSTATDAEDRRIRRRMIAMLEKLESHEQRETDLLQRLYYDDLGIGD